MSRPFRPVLTSFLQRPGLPFADALSEGTMKAAFEDEDADFADDEGAVWIPAVTLWAFLSQVLFKDEQRSCIAAVSRVIALRVALKREPCRTRSFVVVTTLTDDERYPRDDIAELYRCRWMAELDIRSIKITLGMDILRGKSPHMVPNEIRTCLLAYNLIRRVMLQSAQASGQSPRRLSFTATLQSIGASWLVILTAHDDVAASLADTARDRAADHTVGHRPGRVEPRAVKRRPKPHALLTKPRALARAELLEDPAP